MARVFIDGAEGGACSLYLWDSISAVSVESDRKSVV